MAVKKQSLTSKSEYTVSYSGMRGVDFSSSEGTLRRYRYSYLENMYKDYEGGGSAITESVPGFRRIVSFAKTIHSIYTHKDTAGEEYAVIHSGSSLYRFALSDKDSLPSLSSIITLRNKKSCAYTSGSDLYILDGANIVKVDGEGVASKVEDGGEAAPYIPTTYYNGEEYEQRNLLTNLFYEKYFISASSDLAAESEGLKYQIISADENLAAVIGYDKSYGGEVNIPSYTVIGGERYKISEIADSAFAGHKQITRVTVSDTVKRIGHLSFAECANMTEIVLSASVEIIDNGAFAACTELSSVYLGAGLKTIAASAFEFCSNLKDVNYALDATSFSEIDNKANMSAITVNYGVEYTEISVEIPLFSPTKSINSVKLGDEEVTYSQKSANGLISSVIIAKADRTEFNGREVTVFGEMDSAKFTKNSVGSNFILEKGEVISGAAAIKGCTVCESFDGRVFVAGNPQLPNTVFYTARDKSGNNNPLYFGIMNYFNDGTGSFSVRSMLAAGESLAVFKSGDDGCGSIYYHVPKDTGIDILPKIYPVSYIHSGISALGESISFFDDPLFISSLGVCALCKQQINLERSIAVRSRNVNSMLLSEDLSSASLAKWCGYLVVCTGGHIYLADSRQTFTGSTGNLEYEWYYLSGIGSYRGESKVFRYSYVARDDYQVHDKSGEEVEGTVYLTAASDGEPVFYTVEDGVSYEVYTDLESRGGDFFPASCVYSTEDNLLFFGTECGDVCLFNNDKRGVAPPWIQEQADFDAEEYKKHFGKRLHPYYYSFAFHAPRYALTTVADNCDIPHLTKSTVKGSLAVKVRTIGNGYFICEVGTERSGYREVSLLPDTALNFSELDFSALSFANLDYVTLPLKEREKGWIEKEISFYTDKYASPFGIYSITYRFTVKGKIKN